jgi:hypothetical protein
MYQKDYILRMIEMFSEMLAGIFGLIKKGQYDRATERIGKVYYDMLKEDASFFRVIPEEDLTDRLMQKHNYTNGHLEILAELFNAEAELTLAQGNKSGCLEYSRKSLILFKFVDTNQKTYSLERINKMESIQKRIDTLISIL